MSGTPGTELHILLVDDHEDTLAVLKRLLRLEGHTVKATTASRYALEMARDEPFDIVMSDISMPEMDGQTLLSELRAIRPIKSIALTGHAMPEDVQAMKEAGFDDVLIKPINFETLIQSVQAVFAVAGCDGQEERTAYAPNPKILMMKLYNCEKTLAMLTSELERGKLQTQISQIRRRLSEMGYSD